MPGNFRANAPVSIRFAQLKQPGSLILVDANGAHRPYMTQSPSSSLTRIFHQEQINFLLTNHIPRRWATLFVGWLSRLENPIVTRLAMAVWQAFAGKIDTTETKKRRFKSLHDCFIRELRPDARPIHGGAGIAVSPCDGIVGAHGTIDGQSIFQVKGSTYTLSELLCDDELVKCYENGQFVTLRLTSTMYHRFHSPCDCRIDTVNYIAGDTWNVNPTALKRIDGLFCKNERAVIELVPKRPMPRIALIPVAAILVAGIKLHFVDDVLDLRYGGPNRLECDARVQRGEELGYFQHGSTIIVLAERPFRLVPDLREGEIIRMGEPLLDITRGARVNTLDDRSKP